MVATLVDITSSSVTVDYFAQEGYYAKDDPRQRRASFWHGRGARALGLPRQVSPRRFAAILEGRIPGTDRRIGRLRDGEYHHRPGLDLTLSAPKSVSVEALLYGDRKVAQAHDEAVRATLTWLERRLLETRIYDPASGRMRRVRAHGLVAAGFRHLTSREQDPQLHTHCILANMTCTEAGAWRAMEPSVIRQSVKLIGAYYRQELARRLLDLGFHIVPTMVGRIPGFEIAGYPQELLDAFSGRRRQILAYLDARGLPYTAALAQQAALYTRKRKVERPLDAIVAGWRRQAEALGLERDKAQAKGAAQASGQDPDPLAGRPYRRIPAVPAAGLPVLEVVTRAVEHLAERATVFRESEVLAIALGHAPGRHSLETIEAAVARLVAEGHLVATHRGGRRAFVTAHALRSEREIIDWMRAGQGTAQPLAAAAAVAARLDESVLTAGQRSAVRQILLSRDRGVAVQGAAGSGKTTMLRELIALLGDRRVLALAPSTAASRVLAKETGIPTRTLQWFLTRYGDTGQADRMDRAARDLRGAVLILDEASMVSTAQMLLLMRIAERTGIARLILVGDRSQLRAVDAGEPFRALQEAGIATAKMDQILRQREPDLRAAVQQAQAGEPAAAIRGLGTVHEVAFQDLGATAARLWLNLAPAMRDRTVIVAPTHAIRAAVHAEVRAALAREGVLHGREWEFERLVNRHLTAPERADIRNYAPGDMAVFHSAVLPHDIVKDDACPVAGFEDDRVLLAHPSGRTVRIRPADRWVRHRLGVYETARIRIRAGDRIRWTRNHKGHGLVNGELATILAIHSRQLQCRLADGRTLPLCRDDPALRHIDHAYSTTTHGAQGLTCDAVIGVLDSGHGQLTSQASFYVQISRARDQFVLVTDNREQLEETLEAHSGAGLTATEAVNQTEAAGAAPDPSLPLLQSLREDWRALRDRAATAGPALFETDGFDRIVVAAEALAEGPDLPPEAQAFVDEVRSRYTEHLTQWRKERTLAVAADAHCRAWPVLGWAAAEHGCALDELPQHVAWRARGEQLLASGQRLLGAAAATAGGAGQATSRGRLASLLERIRSIRLRDWSVRLRYAWTGLAEWIRERVILPALGLAQRYLRDHGQLEGEAELLGLPAVGLPAYAPWRDRVSRLLTDCGRLRPAADHQRDVAGEAQGDASPARLADAIRNLTTTGAILREHLDRDRDAGFCALDRTVAEQAQTMEGIVLHTPGWLALEPLATELRDAPGAAPDIRARARELLAASARERSECAPIHQAIADAEAVRDRGAELEAEPGRQDGTEPAPDHAEAWRVAAAGRMRVLDDLLDPDTAGTPGSAAARHLAHMPAERARLRELRAILQEHLNRDRDAGFRALGRTVAEQARAMDGILLHTPGWPAPEPLASELRDAPGAVQEVRARARALLAAADRERSECAPLHQAIADAEAVRARRAELEAEPGRQDGTEQAFESAEAWRIAAAGRMRALDDLLDPDTAGTPTSAAARHLAHMPVERARLRELGAILQEHLNRDRDAGFRALDRTVAEQAQAIDGIVLHTPNWPALEPLATELSDAPGAAPDVRARARELLAASARERSDCAPIHETIAAAQSCLCQPVDPHAEPVQGVSAGPDVAPLERWEAEAESVLRSIDRLLQPVDQDSDLNAARAHLRQLPGERDRMTTLQASLRTRLERDRSARFQNLDRLVANLVKQAEGTGKRWLHSPEHQALVALATALKEASGADPDVRNRARAVLDADRRARALYEGEIMEGLAEAEQLLKRPPAPRSEPGSNDSAPPHQGYLASSVDADTAWRPVRDGQEVERDGPIRGSIADRQHAAAILAPDAGREPDPHDFLVLRRVANQPGTVTAINCEKRHLRWTRWSGHEPGSFRVDGSTPLIPGDRIAWTQLQAGHIRNSRPMYRQAIVIDTGPCRGMQREDWLALRILSSPNQGPGGPERTERTVGGLVDSGAVRLPWRDEQLRTLELARLGSLPTNTFAMHVMTVVPDDRLRWVEHANTGDGAPALEDTSRRTIEARVVDVSVGAEPRADRLRLRVLEAAGVSAPGPGTEIDRLTAAVLAAGCFRAKWDSEDRRSEALTRQERKRKSSQGTPSRGRGGWER